MILLPLFFVYFSGLVILYVFRLDRWLHSFEILGLSFGTGLSLFVFVLFLQGVFKGHLSMIPVVYTFFVVMMLFIVKQVFQKEFVPQVARSVKSDLISIKNQFVVQQRWRRVLILFVLVYAITKLVMAFGINVSHPTIGEDSITGWDLKTKVFFENRSLVLDPQNPEFLGGETMRNVYAPLADFFFIMLYREFPVGLSNVLSPLVYLNLCFIFFGIFFRKAGLNYAAISVYVLLSLPFLFVHAFESYMNLPSTYFIFAVGLYFWETLLASQKSPMGQCVPLLFFMALLACALRSENLYYVLFIVGLEVVMFFCVGKARCWRRLFLPLAGVGLALLLVITANKYFETLDPSTAGHLGQMNQNILVSAWQNILKPDVFLAPFAQVLFHPDYNLLFLTFMICSVAMVFYYKRTRELWPLFLVTIGMTVFVFCTLYAYLDFLGIMSHYCFRYVMVLIPFMIYTSLMTVYWLRQPLNVAYKQKDRYVA